jgi:hypothetical protein
MGSGWVARHTRFDEVAAILGVAEQGLAVVAVIHDMVASGRPMLIPARCAGHVASLIQ